MKDLSNVTDYPCNDEIEIDMELSETDLMSRVERKKEYLSNSESLLKKKQRDWLVKHGKSNLLDF